MATAAAVRRERGRQEMREAILEAARRILAEDGGDALSMRAVARAIGYSPAALYEYFPAKENLVESLYFEGAGGLEGRLRAMLASLPASATASDALTALGHAYRAFAREQPELFRLIFFRRPPDAPAVPTEHADGSGFGALVEVMTRGVETGEFVPAPPPVLAITAWSHVHGFVVLELGGFLTGGGPPSRTLRRGGDPSPDALFAAVVDLAVAGIRRR
jgi:AcrR family transcriptional regulator